MIFKENKYTGIYWKIILRAKNRAKTKTEAKRLLGYAERHHIIPRCMGGSDLSDNLVFLTAKEHFIVHMLLVRMVIDTVYLNSMRFALWKFQQSNENQDRKRITAWEYDYMKRECAEASSIMNSGKVMPERSKEHRKKLSDAHKGKPSKLKGRSLPDETKDKISEKLKGRESPTKGKKLRPRSAEHTANHAASRRGKPGRRGIPQTEETKQKISDANKGRAPWNKGLSDKVTRKQPATCASLLEES